MSDNHKTYPMNMLNEKKAEAYRIKKEFIDKLNSGEIDFLDLLEFAKGSQYSNLRRIKISSILSSREGWSYQEAKNALIGHGLNPDIRVESVMKSKNKTERINALINASPSNWGERLPAPTGWPWFGNILDTLKELDSKKLPRELVESVRYEFGDDAFKDHYVDEKDHDEYHHENSEADDVLNDIFGDESEEDSDDDIDNELNDLLGFDEDDDEGDSSSDIFSAL